MKSVILFNQREMTYAVVGMNYTDDEAAAEVGKMKSLGAFHVDQKGRTFSSEKELETRMLEITGGRAQKVSL